MAIAREPNGSGSVGEHADPGSVATWLRRSTGRPAGPRDGEPGRFSYARDNHPTAVACEAALGVLDAGGAVLPVRHRAVTSVLLTMSARADDRDAEAAYYGHAQLCVRLEPWGVRYVEFDQGGVTPAGGRSRADRGAREPDL